MDDEIPDLKLNDRLFDEKHMFTFMAMGFSKENMAEYVTETEEYIMPLLDVIKNEGSELNNASWLISYQMKAILETIKRLI